MSDFFEQKQNDLDAAADQNVSGAALDNNAEESTIFSAPAEHNDKAPKAKGKKRIISVIAACLAVAILIGGTIAVIKLIPEMTAEETPSSMFEDIKVIETDTNGFKDVTVTNKNGEFKFVKQKIESTDDDGKTNTTEYWGVEGIDISKLSTSTLNSMMSAAAEIIAVREIDTKTAAECGLDKPKLKIAVTATEEKHSYTVLVGDTSPDGLGSYMMVEGIDTIYVASDSEFSSFDFALTDLADKTSIPTTLFNADTSDNKSEDGAYAFFDSLTIEGKNFSEKITIINNPAETDSAGLVPYIVSTPTKRYANAENLTSLVNLFSNEITVAGCYAFDITDATLKEFGLDNPDVTVTMTIDGEAKSFKISKIDDQYCAVIYDGATMIRKCNTTSFEFIDFKAENLYYKNMFMHSINDVKALSFTNADCSIKFDITSKQDEDQNTTYTIKSGDKTLVTSEFQTFYGNLVTIQSSDFNTDQITTSHDSTVTFTFTDNSSSIVKFYKANATEYQYSIDGIMMGKIPSSTYNNMVKDFNDTAAGK